MTARHISRLTMASAAALIFSLGISLGLTPVAAAAEETLEEQGELEQIIDGEEESLLLADDEIDTEAVNSASDQDAPQQAPADQDAPQQAPADQAEQEADAETPAGEANEPESNVGESASEEPAQEATAAVPLAPTAEPLLVPAEKPARRGHWEVTSKYGQGLQRYWIWNDDGSRAKNELIGPENGAGYYAYARPDTTIVRGKWDKGNGNVYIADNNGKLIGSDVTEDRFIVTKEYDGGWQRYYVSATTKAARSGFFSVPGYGDLFGMGGQGYIRRGDFTFGGKKFSADNDGRLRSGWYVTTGFGQGLQRYWMGDVAYGSPHAAATNRLVSMEKDGSSYYAWAKADSTILRGKWDNQAGFTYVADNNGKLIGSDLTSDGFVVTSLYDGVPRRYYVSASTKAAKSGFFRIPDYGDCFGIGGQGYVLQGTKKFGNSVIIADVHGRLPGTEGWLCSDAYGQKMQRYWVEKIYKDFLGTKPGYSEGGYAHYTVDEGYVLRNEILVPGNGKILEADNDGRLKEIKPGWRQINGHWKFYSADVRARFDNDILANGRNLGHYDILHDIWLNIKDGRSGTGYLIATSWDASYLAIFKGSQGNWEPLFGWNCTTGDLNICLSGDGMPWDGTYDYYMALGNKGGNDLEGGDAWANSLTNTFAGSRRRYINANEQYFTSVDYQLGFHTWLYSKDELGKHLSHGCTRLDYPNARWIYENVAPGTRCISLRTKTYS